MEKYPWAPGERGRIAMLGTLVLGSMLYPLRQHLRPNGTKVDGFPLSYYPMFSKLRKQNVTIYYAVGLDAAGDRHYLPHDVLGSGRFNQVRHQLNRLVRMGRAQEYAIELAARVAGDPDRREIVRVDVVRGRFDVDACLLSGQVCGADTVLASADVGGARSPETTAAGSEAGS